MNRLQFLLSLLFVLSLPLLSYGQLEDTYRVSNYSSSNSRDLIRAVKHSEYDDAKEVRPLQKKLDIIYTYKNIELSIVRQINKGLIIEDSTFQHYVQSIFSTIIHRNELSQRSRHILISRDYHANASCMGQGTFIVTMGLLSKSENESQIAFVLAHELAHYELKHVFQRIEREVENKTNKTVTKKAKKIIVNNSAQPEDLEELRDIVYTETRFTRKMETQADSLAIVYLSKTNYNASDAIDELTMLDSALVPKYDLGDNWFEAFKFNKYPFQQYWLKPRLSVYDQKRESVFIFDIDSILSHPEISARKAALVPYLSEQTDKPHNIQPQNIVNEISTKADFECIESAYSQKQYDFCMYYTLQLLSVYPANSYLVSKVGLMLLQLYESKDYGTFSNYVPGYTAYYPAPLKQVNNFLHNLTKEELGELAYHFINKKPHFNSTVEEHYYLLWRASVSTKRTDVQKKIEEAYQSKYDKKITSFDDPFAKDIPKYNYLNEILRTKNK